LIIIEIIAESKLLVVIEKQVRAQRTCQK